MFQALMTTKMFQALKTTKMYWALMSLRISVYPNLNPPHGYLIMAWLLQFVACGTPSKVQPQFL